MEIPSTSSRWKRRWLFITLSLEARLELTKKGRNCSAKPGLEKFLGGAEEKTKKLLNKIFLTTKLIHAWSLRKFTPRFYRLILKG
jgi:hypothetical protein